MTVAFEFEDMADGGFAGGDGQILATHDRGKSQHAGETNVAELILEAAYGHVGEFSDCIFDDIGSAQFDLALGHAEHQADSVDGKSLGQAKIDRTVDFTGKSNRINDFICRTGGGPIGLAHQGDVTIQHGLADISDRLKNGFLDDGVGDLLGGGHAISLGKDKMIGPY